MSVQGLNPFAEFAREIHKELMGFFRRRVDCPEAAADLTQETLLRLQDGGRYEKTDNLRATTFHIASNLAIDYSRRSQTRTTHTAELGDDFGIEVFACPKPGPESQVSDRQSVEKINFAFAQLPESERTILYLSVVEGMTYAQISEMTSTPLRTVAKRLAHALKCCRASLDA